MRTRNWAAAAATVIVLGAIPVAAQQELPVPLPLEPVPPDQVTDSFDIDDGEYTGTVGLGGIFWFYDETQGVLVIWRGSGTGPMEFTVTNSALTGTWGMDGAAEVVGYGFPFELRGTNTWTMSGSVSGEGPYRLSGSGSSTSSVTAAGQNQESTSPIEPINVPLDGIVQVCGQVVGNWDQAIDAGFEGAPLSHELRTYFTVFAADLPKEMQDRADDLVEAATAVQRDLDSPAFLVTRDLALLLDDAEELLEDMENAPDSCPPDPTFMRVITQIVADVMNTFLSRWATEPSDQFQAQDLQRMVAIGLRAGAIGAGAADAGSADHLLAGTEQVLQKQFDEAVAGDSLDLEALQLIAVTATMLDYTFESGVSGSDICIMMGGC